MTANRLRLCAPVGQPYRIFMHGNDQPPLFPLRDERRPDPSAYPRPSLKQVGAFDRDRLEEKLLSDYDRYEAPRGFSLPVSPRALAVAAGACGGLALLALLIYVVASHAGGGAPHLVTADASPVRVKPDDPGGVFVDHEDKSVYEAMRGESPSALPKVLHILPETEKPANIYDMRPAKDSDKKTEETKEGATENVPQEPSATQTAEAAEPQPKRTEKAPDVDAMLTDYIYGKDKPASVAGEEEATPPSLRSTPVFMAKPTAPPRPAASATPETTAPTPPKKEAAPDKHIMKNVIPGNFVQVGAFSDTDDAGRHINKVLGAFPALIEGKTDYYYQPVSLADKKTLYRLKIGPFSGEKAARDACAKMAQKNMDCMYVRH
ncbi:MAG: SPOR domain-containing protein [Rickettsiales bacterium]